MSSKLFKSLLYTVEQSKDRYSEYTSLSIALRAIVPLYNEERVSQDKVIAFNWQTSKNSNGYWYGCNLTDLPTYIGDSEAWAKLATLVSTLIKAIDKRCGKQSFSSLTPQDIATMFESLGVRPGVYDDRTKAWELAETVKPGSYRRYEAFKTHDAGYSFSWALAETEREAQRDVTLRMEADPYMCRSATYTGWLRADRPMRECGWDEPRRKTFEDATWCDDWVRTIAPDPEEVFLKEEQGIDTRLN